MNCRFETGVISGKEPFRQSVPIVESCFRWICMGKWIAIIWCCSIMALMTCSRREPDRTGKMLIYVSVPPQKFFVDKLCGESCTVKSLIPPGASPHTFEPRPSQMADLADATLYFAVGVEMEQVWLPRIREINPHLRIVRTDSGISKLSMHSFESDGGKEEHHISPHGTIHSDPHIWLSPALVKSQIRTMVEALGTVDSAHHQWYRRRLVEFEASIDTVEQKTALLLASCGSRRSFLTIHPSWGYFADAFNLKQIAVEVEGKEPGIRELGKIVAYARNEQCDRIVIQPQFSRKMARMIADKISADVVVADPLAEDWDRNLLRLAKALCK